MAEKQGTQADSPFDRLPGGRQVRALHGAIEHSLAIQRTRLTETMDDFVSRGRISREDADRLVDQLVENSQGFSRGILDVIDSAVSEARRGVGSVVEGAGGVVKKVTGR